MLKAKYLLLLAVLFMAGMVSAQGIDIQRVEPAFWWTGMKNPELQILFYGKDISRHTPSVKYAGVQLKNKVALESPNYVLITLKIDKSAKAGKIPVIFKSPSGESVTYQYELRNKSNAPDRIQGFSSADLIYLIMPDRFSNGDVSNDQVAGMPDLAVRDSGYARHGGDLQGINNHLDYLKGLGVTALWLNPVLENNMPQASYHGYAITDFYSVDKRFGGNQLYLDFINKTHSMGMKVIMDMVLNHIGSNHWMMKDLPSKNWVHQHKEFTRSNFRLSTISDPHASKRDTELMTDGWFDTTMPDLNQQDPHLATYLIQNSIWWIEYSGIDGIRMDTYPYPDKKFMADWAKAIMTEYPRFNIVGEVWIHNSSAISGYWQKGALNKDGYTTTLPSLTDFPVYNSIIRGLNEPMTWDTGLSRLYYTLAEDFVYADPSANVIFLDNHDLNRFYTDMKEDFNKYKQGVALLMTMRGIPQLYYGTEILMTGDAGKSHPEVRRDFPGGWQGDQINVFTGQGLTSQQKEALDYMKKLANWRAQNPVIHTGKLTHFVPENNIYVYFRHNDQKTVMVILNTGTGEQTLDTKRFEECTSRYKTGTNVVTGETVPGLGQIKVPAQSAMVLELVK